VIIGSAEEIATANQLSHTFAHKKSVFLLGCGFLLFADFHRKQKIQIDKNQIGK
jgi:hypothetical protein